MTSEEREICMTHPDRGAVAFAAYCRECWDQERKDDRELARFRSGPDWRKAAEEVIARLTSETLLPSQRQALIALGDALRASPGSAAEPDTAKLNRLIETASDDRYSNEFIGMLFRAGFSVDAGKPPSPINADAAKRYGCQSCGASIGQAHRPDCATGLGLAPDETENDAAG